MKALDIAIVDVRSNCWRFALLLLCATARVAVGQDPTPGAVLPTDARSSGSAQTHGLVFLPVLGAGPTFGFGGGAVLATVFRVDSLSRRSGIGVGGLVAERSSWTVSIGGRVDFQRDNWRTLFGLAQYDMRYRFFGVGNAAGDANRSLIAQQDGTAGVIEALHRVVGQLYAGLRYRIDDVSMGVDQSDAANPLAGRPRADSSVTIGELGVAAEYDTRDDEVAPRHGTFARGAAMFARTGFGGDRNIDSYDLWLNHYVPVHEHDVLAFRASLCATGVEAPLWQLCMFGAQNDLRGYVVGRYRDRTMFAVQSEYRALVYHRIGVSAFAGVGEVAPTWSDLTSNHLLVSGGPGLRYLVSRTHRLNLGVEYAFATRGGAYYFRIGEAF